MKTKLKIESAFNSKEFSDAVNNSITAFDNLRISLNKIDRLSKFEKFYDFISNFLFGGKRTILLLFILFSLNITAQEKHTSIMLGYKSLELGYTYTDEETELIFGISISGVDANTAEKRANKNDKGKHHEFNGSIVPAVYGLIGAKFDKLNIIGKIGGSYVSQSINNEPTKDLFLALGLMASYLVNERYSIVSSYDSVNSVQAGIMIRL